MATDDPTFAAAMSSFQTAAAPVTLDPVAAALASSTSSTTETYSTSLPASPTDGTTAILVDSTTAPTYQWRFRYNGASAGSYKWEYVGGTPKVVETATSEATSSTSYADLATVGPSFTVPNAGVYVVSYGYTVDMTTTDQEVWVTVKLGSAASADADSAPHFGHTANNFSHTSRTMSRTLAAADVLKMQYKIYGAGGNGTFQNRWMTVVPARVS